MVSFRDPNTEWLNTVAHDLKSPINSVRGCVDMVMQLGPLNERQEHFATRALAGLQRLEHLVSRLLDMSWVEADAPLELSEVVLGDLIDDAVDLLREVAAQRGIKVKTKVDSRITPIVADERRLGQVLDNLISNAIKYNRQDGKVTIKAAYDHDSVVVSVQDTGIGISEEEQDRVFERFFRSLRGVELKIEGSGLGLAITQAIVQKHGGRIWFESRPDKGTTFHFSLPLRAASGEGDDEVGEMPQALGEFPEAFLSRQADLSSEASDSVDDNLQESNDDSDGDVDSASDER